MSPRPTRVPNWNSTTATSPGWKYPKQLPIILAIGRMTLELLAVKASIGLLGQNESAQNSGTAAQLWRHHILVDIAQHFGGADVAVQQLHQILTNPCEN